MDNFRVIYRILRYLEKALDYDEPNMDCISAKALKLSDQRWVALMEMLSKEGYIDDLAIELVIPFRTELAAYMQALHADDRREVRRGKISDELAGRLRSHLDQFKAHFLEEHGLVGDGEDDEDGLESGVLDVGDVSATRAATEQAMER